MATAYNFNLLRTLHAYVVLREDEDAQQLPTLNSPYKEQQRATYIEECI
jgi:hypothetical protein